MMKRACVLGVGLVAALLFTAQPAVAQVNFGITAMGRGRPQNR